MKLLRRVYQAILGPTRPDPALPYGYPPFPLSASEWAEMHQEARAVVSLSVVDGGVKERAAAYSKAA